MKEEVYLVSKCLMGHACKYNGGDNLNEAVGAFLQEEGRKYICVCPEQDGGLPTPREPAEVKTIDGARVVINASGENVTAAFERGALSALELATANGIKTAILKSRSPSCGKGKIYDGSFSKTLTPGDGICAALLMANGIKVMDEHDVEENGN